MQATRSLIMQICGHEIARHKILNHAHRPSGPRIIAFPHHVLYPAGEVHQLVFQTLATLCPGDPV